MITRAYKTCTTIFNKILLSKNGLENFGHFNCYLEKHRSHPATYVQPVPMRQVMFLTVYSFLMLVFDMIGVHKVLAYFKMGPVIPLNVETINCFCLPLLVEVSIGLSEKSFY